MTLGQILRGREFYENSTQKTPCIAEKIAGLEHLLLTQKRPMNRPQKLESNLFKALQAICEPWSSAWQRHPLDCLPMHCGVGAHTH